MSSADYQSLGETRGVTLRYDSEFASPHPIIRFFFNDVPNWGPIRLADTLLFATLRVSRPGSAGGFVVFGSDQSQHFWTLPPGGGDIEAALQAELRSQPTGRYQYELSAGFVGNRVTGGGVGTTFSGETLVVNLSNSPFGAGWGLDGLQEIVENSDGSLLLVDQGGLVLPFDPPQDGGNEYESPDWDFSTLVRLPNGRFQRTLKDQTVYLFNDENQLESVRDRNGNQTTYAYDAAGLLHAITDPVGLETTFHYTGGNVTSITDPASRVTQFEYDALGNLTRITDPDNTSRIFGYDAEHHLTSEVDKRGFKEESFYGFHGRVERGVLADGSEIWLAAADVLGLYPPEQTMTQFDAPPAVQRGAVNSEYVDANGHVTRTTLDNFGRALFASDAVGRGSRFVRNDQGLVELLVDGRGNLTQFNYDDRGNVVSVTDEITGLIPGPDAIIWISETSGDWDDPANWSTGTVPGPEDEAFISLPAVDITVTYSGGASTIANLRSSESLVISSGSMTVTGLSKITGALTVSQGATLAADGPEAFLIASGPTIIDGANLTASGGGIVNLPGATTYTHNTGCCVHRTFRAQGTGSLLNLSNLTTLTGSTAFDAAVIIEALDGGQVDLRNLTRIPGGTIQVLADMTNSDVDLSNLGSFSDTTRNSRLEVRNGGTVEIPLLTNLDGVDLTIDATGTIATSQIVSYTNGEATINGTAVDLSNVTNLNRSTIDLRSGGTVDLTNATNIDQANFFVKDGVTLSLPAATSYSNAVSSCCTDRFFRAEGPGSVLDLSNLSTLTGSTAFDAAVIIETLDGGQVDLSSVTSIPDGTLHVLADGTGSVVDLSALVSFTDSTGDSRLEAHNGGVVLIPNLVTVIGVTIDIDPIPPGAGLAAPSDLTLKTGNGPATSTNSVIAASSDVEFEPSPRTFTYDPVFNQLASITDELGRQTLFEIDPTNGNILSETRVVGLPDSSSGETDDIVTLFTYEPNGLVDTRTDPLGRITDFDYDAPGRLVSITYAQNTADEGAVQFEYDLAGNVTATIDENNNRTEFEYDAMNRLTLLRDAISNTTEFEYDADGNLIKTIDALGHPTQNLYDVLGRLIRTIDALGNVTSFFYDKADNLIKVVDPLGNLTRNLYDARDRLVQTTDPDNGVTRFAYVLDDNLTALMDPVANRTEFAYDARDRMVEEMDPLGNAIVYQYDAVDNLIEKLDRNGRTTEFQYDDLDRLTTETWVNPDTTIANTVAYTYDAVGNLFSAADSFSALGFQYDAGDRVTSVDNVGTPNASHVVLDYTYDAVGNVLTVSDTIDTVAGGVTSSQYDALNRMSQIIQAGSGVTDKRVDFAYNPIGQFASITRYSDLAGTQLVIDTAYTYDGLNRLADLRHSNSTTDVVFYTYTYDQANRITRIVDVDGTHDYSYDTRSQLIGADHSDPANSDEFYVYDAIGNRESSSLHGAAYVTGTANRLLSDGEFNYEYDDEGNLILRTEIATGGRREFEWDHRNRLVAAVDKDELGQETQRVEFAYNVFGRRISKRLIAAIDQVLTHFVYDGETVILDCVDDDGPEGANPATLARRYLHGPKIDEVLADEVDAANTSWLLSNHLGTNGDLVDDSGTLLNHIRYDTFGNVVSQSNPSSSARYLFTGREFDTETGVYYYRMRYYQAGPGRFISEDPLAFAAGDENLYRYVGNSPTAFTDPSGLAQCCGIGPGQDCSDPGNPGRKDESCQNQACVRHDETLDRLNKEKGVTWHDFKDPDVAQAHRDLSNDSPNPYMKWLFDKFAKKGNK